MSALTGAPIDTQSVLNSGACTARQTLRFVDTSDDKQLSIPSPAPQIMLQSNPSLELKSARIADKTTSDAVSKRLVYDSNAEAKQAPKHGAISASVLQKTTQRRLKSTKGASATA